MAQCYNCQYRPIAVWAQSDGGSIPVASVSGGYDVNSETLYIGRAVHGNDTIPGKVVPSHGCCYVTHAGVEHNHRSYQVLTNPNGSNLVWIRESDGRIPLGALQGGKQSDGQVLYIGRAEHNGSLIIGKVLPNHGVIYIPFGGEEIPKRDYEILVCKEIQL